MKKLMMLLVIMCFMVSSMPDVSDARSRGGSSFRSSSFKSSSFKSFNSSKGAGKSVFKSRSGGGLFGKAKSSKSSKVKKVVPTKKFTGGSKIQKKAIVAKQKKSSAKSYNNYKQKFKKPATKVAPATKQTYSKSPIYSKTKSRNITRRDYHQTRTNYYSAHHYSMPSYGYNSYSSFGMYDAMFMWMMLDNINDANYSRMYHHHQQDAGFQQWRTEANRLSADNAELKAKLTALDTKVSTIKEPIDPAYVPTGIPTELILNSDTILPEKPVLRIATGNPNLNYHHFGNLMKKELNDNISIVLVPTSGSVENLNLIKSGKVDACMVQSNVIKMFEKEHPNANIVTEQFSVYPEPVQLISSRDSGIDNIDDLSNDHIIIAGPSNSGTDKTWVDFGVMDSDYRDPQKMNMNYDDALNTIINNKKSAMVIVAGLKSPFMMKINQSAIKNNLQLVPVDDFGFFDLDDVNDKNGNPIYSVVDIPSTTYPNLQAGKYWGTNSIETVAVDAIFMLSTKWVQSNDMKYTDKVAVGLVNVQPKMLKRVGLK